MAMALFRLDLARDGIGEPTGCSKIMPTRQRRCMKRRVFPAWIWLEDQINAAKQLPEAAISLIAREES